MELQPALEAEDNTKKPVRHLRFVDLSGVRYLDNPMAIVGAVVEHLVASMVLLSETIRHRCSQQTLTVVGVEASPA